MNDYLLKEQLAKKFSNIFGSSVPAEIPELDNIQNSCGRLFFEGSSWDNKKLQKSYDFKFRWYSKEKAEALEKINFLEKYLREAMPEIFFASQKHFYSRYYAVKSVKTDKINIAGTLYFYAELEFSLVS